VKQTTDRVISNREYLRDKLIKMGIEVPESGANFIFAKVKNPKCVYEQLKKRKILVRYFNAPMMNDGLRMTIGTRKQVNVLLKELKNIIFDNP
jgi:histidinol-phosphate aminotransferase